MKNDPNFRKLMEFMILKKEKIQELLEYTKSKDFKVELDEIEHIHLFIRKRGFIFDEINPIESTCKEILLANPSYANDNEFIAIKQLIDTSINEIIDMDIKNNKIFQQNKELVQEEIKKASNGNKIFNKYVYMNNLYEDSSSFESFS